MMNLYAGVLPELIMHPSRICLGLRTVRTLIKTSWPLRPFHMWCATLRCSRFSLFRQDCLAQLSLFQGSCPHCIARAPSSWSISQRGKLDLRIMWYCLRLDQSFWPSPVLQPYLFFKPGWMNRVSAFISTHLVSIISIAKYISDRWLPPNGHESQTPRYGRSILFQHAKLPLTLGYTARFITYIRHIASCV
jgi:hypothetical protein